MMIKKIVTAILLSTLCTAACVANTGAAEDYSTPSNAQEVLQNNQESSEESITPPQGAGNMTQRDLIAYSLFSEVSNSTSSQNPELLSIISTQQDLIQKLIQISSKNNTKQSDIFGMTYADFSAVLLAAVAVIVTALGVGIAILSIWGFNNIKASSIKSAETVSNEIATRVAEAEVSKNINEVTRQEVERLSDEGKLTKHLESAVDIILRTKKADGSSGFNNYPELDEEIDGE